MTDASGNSVPTQVYLQPEAGANGRAIEPIVTAKGSVNGTVFEDVNQTAEIGASNAPALIADRVAKKLRCKGSHFPMELSQTHMPRLA